MSFDLAIRGIVLEGGGNPAADRHRRPSPQMDTVGIQRGYSGDTVRIQWGYSEDTVGIQRKNHCV